MTERLLLALSVPLSFWWGASQPAPTPVGPPQVKIVRVENPVSERLGLMSERVSVTSERVTELHDRVDALAGGLRCNLLYLGDTKGKTRRIRGQSERQYILPGKRARIAPTGSKGVPAATTWPGFPDDWKRSERCSDGYFSSDTRR